MLTDKQSMFGSHSPSSFLESSQGIRKVELAIKTFRQLESELDHQPVPETIFMNALTESGLDDSVARRILGILHSQGQIYEISPRVYRSM